MNTEDANLGNAQPLPDSDDAGKLGSSSDYREVKWEVVAETGGILPAEIMVGRLRSVGIPARAWQEGAGQALGLYVGKLGMGQVVVPEEFAEQARAILADEQPLLDEDEDADYSEED